MSEAAFYLIWSPSGVHPPSCKHETYRAAKTEAERLAGTSPHAQFYVLRAISLSKKVSVITETLTDLDEDLPF